MYPLERRNIALHIYSILNSLSRAFKECASRFPCKLIDEFRITQICYLDDSVLKKWLLKEQ